jgi:hypothetical protein
MGIRAFDRAFVDEAMAEFEALKPDQEPEWGSMRPPQLFAHLITAVRYGLGKEEESPPEGSFLIRRILAPLLLAGVMKLPKNVDKPKMYDAEAPQGTPEELRAEMEEHLSRLSDGTLNPPPHPALGDLGPDGWSKLHVIHFEHHLRQFGRQLRTKG